LAGALGAADFKLPCKLWSATVTAPTQQSKPQPQPQLARWSLHIELNAQRSHRLCNHLERPRRQRGECRGQLRAAVGRNVCRCTPLAREHHGDEHLEPLHAKATVVFCVCMCVLASARVSVVTSQCRKWECLSGSA
jgi:hypothetical protein